MLDLKSLQDAMAPAIVSGKFTAIAGEFSNSERLPIFTNNTYLSLTAALKATFPITVQLADERFFSYAAHAFIQHHPAREPMLSRFGAGFPSFLRAFPACSAYPIIAEMAAFEWKMAASLQCEDLPRAPLSVMKNCTESERAGLQLQPSLGFALSRLPLKQIWEDHRSGTLSSYERRVHRLAIARSGEELRVFELDGSQFIFWRMLQKGHSIPEAALRALAREPLFDIVREVVVLFRIGLVTAITEKPTLN